MESFTDAVVLEDQTTSCNAVTVLASSVDANGSVPNVEGLENLGLNNTHIISDSELIPEAKYLNGKPLDYKDPIIVVKNDLKKDTVPHEDELPVKVVSPTIFENAVNVVKNLFSPAKAHGIFSRGVSQQDKKELETKKIPNGDIVSGNTCFKTDQLPVIERKGSLSFSNVESSLCFNEEDTFSLVAKHFSNSVDAHNNTNDSYTSTVSRMDESFQSTVTHFDDCMQNEIGNSNNFAENIENISVFDNSMNDTIDANDHSLNNTLKKNISSSIIENGELNVTFEGNEIKDFFIPEIENEELCRTYAKTLHESSSSCVPQVPEGEVPKNIESSLEIVTEEVAATTEIVTSHEIKGKQSLLEETWTDITSSSTPKKQQSFEETDHNNSPVLNNFPQTLNDLDQKKVENIVENFYSSPLKDTDAQNEENLSRFSTIAHSSDIVYSDSAPMDNFLLEKSTSPALCTPLEKNFSTSTIVISKNDLDNINSSKEKDILVPQQQLSIKDHESPINSDIQTGNIENITVMEQEHSEGGCAGSKEEMDLCSNNKPQLILNEAHREDTGKSFNISSNFNMNEFVKNYSLESISFNKSDIEKPHISEKGTIEIFDKNMEILNLMENNFFCENELELKSECPINEVEIPLASQKSYTVLHNMNPTLNLPVVSDNTCDVEADKLNDIILGNRTFSDLNVLYDKNIHSNVITIASNQIDASKSNYIEVNTDGILTDSARNISSDGSDLKTCDLEIPINVTLNTADNLELAESALLTSLESNTTTFVEPEKETTKYLEEKESSNSISPLNNTSELSNSVSEKMPKSESAIFKSENSVPTGENSPEADLLFLSGKKDDKMNKKSHSELELSPLGKHIFNDEAAKESFGNNIIPSFICGDGDSLSNGNLDILVEKNNFVGGSCIEDLCANEEEIKDLDLNTESKYAENIESKMKDSIAIENDFEIPTLQADLDNVISDLERLKMNDSSTEKPNICYSDNDNPFSISSKLNDTVNLGDEDDLSEKNMKASNSVTELTQFIKEQFTVTDIEKICSVVDDMPELNLSKNIAIASQQFDKSFHGKILNESDNNVMKVNNFVINDENDLDFLDSIKGKPSGRDYSRESLYIKFDPLVQSKHSTTLLDISEGDKENVIASPTSRNNNTSDSLIPITPLKQNININSASPLTPTSQNNECKLSTEKLYKLRELQNEISRLREYYLQREGTHKEKMNNYENVIAELTGKASVLEDKLKESEEMEKILLKKLNSQNDSISRLRSTIEECMTHISKLTDDLQNARKDTQKQISVLKEERDYYMNHLQMTEQAFSDVFNKYEKCKEAVKTYKKNEEIYKLNIDNMKDRIEQYSEKVRSMQESAAKEVNKLQEKMNDLKLNQTQEISKYKAQLRITELKVQTMQEALEQKIKENQELAGICDELIESKECDR